MLKYDKSGKFDEQTIEGDVIDFYTDDERNFLDDVYLCYCGDVINLNEEQKEKLFEKISKESLIKRNGLPNTKTIKKLVKYYSYKELFKAHNPTLNSIWQTFVERLVDDGKLVKERTFGETLKQKIKQYKDNKHQFVFIGAVGGSLRYKKVSQYKPNFVIEVLRKYCPQGGNYYDFSCGWGERLLTSLSFYKYNYYGTEPNKKQVENLIKMRNDFFKYNGLSSYVDIRTCGSEKTQEDFIGKMDIMFSSPPYYNLEIYDDDESQSYHNNMSFFDWQTNYVRKTLENCYLYGKQGSKLVINVSNYNEVVYLEDCWKNEAERAGFRFIEKFELLQSNNSLRKQKITDKKLKYEKFYVFEK